MSLAKALFLFRFFNSKRTRSLSESFKNFNIMEACGMRTFCTVFSYNGGLRAAPIFK
jgi:hypothetical protein